MFSEKYQITQAIRDKAMKVKLVIFDMDGVLTDGCAWVNEQGVVSKQFNYHDGLGISFLQEAGFEVAIITGDRSGVVNHRAERLRIKHVYQGRISKLSSYKDLIEKLNLKDEQVAYLGDDIVDLPVLRQVGLPVAVHNAHTQVKEVADWVTTCSGGSGAARELCDLILDVHGRVQEELIEKLSQTVKQVYNKEIAD